jgi:hypothetical protein
VDELKKASYLGLDLVVLRPYQAKLTTAIDAGVAEWFEGDEHLRDEQGPTRVLDHNGHWPGEGSPDVHDRRDDNGEKLSPRRFCYLDDWLYLKGISTGDFNEALVRPECPVSPFR